MLKITLPHEEKVRIGSALLKMPSPYETLDEALLHVYPVFALLPRELLGKLLDFGRYPHSAAVLQVDNLPTDPALPPTPNTGARVQGKATYVGEGCLLGLSQLLGEPIGYRTEKQGEIIHNVVPVRGGEYTQSNQGSGVFLNFHNDTVYDESGCFNASNPDFLVLNCLRADVQGQAETYYVDARQALGRLDGEAARALREPAFLFAAPSTFTRERAAGQIVWSKPLPIITGPESAPEICMTANGIKPVGSAAERAYRLLLEACEAVKLATSLVPGRALLINNRKGVHARSVFTASFDSSDRWLQRTYIRRELWKIRDRRAEGARVH